MSKLNLFRDFITQRLTTATMEIFRAAEKSFAEFEGEISRSKEESARLQRLLDNVTQPDIKLHRTGLILICTVDYDFLYIILYSLELCLVARSHPAPGVVSK